MATRHKKGKCEGSACGLAEATREMDMRNVESPGCQGQATHAPAGSEIWTAETLRPEQYGPLTQKLGIPAASRCRHRLARNQTGQKRKQHLSARHAWPYSRGLHAVTGSPGGKKQKGEDVFPDTTIHAQDLLSTE